MLVISAGMQKAGSAYAYNLINDMLVHAGHRDAREIRDKYGLGDVLKWQNNNIGVLDRKLLTRLLLLSFKEGTFAVKTHAGPTGFLSLLLRLGLVRLVYIYRDPRDALLSVLDHSKKSIEEGTNHPFSRIKDFDEAFRAVKRWTGVYKAYAKTNGALVLNYEKLASDPVGVMKIISSHLKIDIPGDVLISINSKYDKDNPDADLSKLHFNKAIVNRYKDELSEEQRERFRQEMGEVMEEMGYEA